MTEAIPESECLRGKVAAVTGAARGISRATAIAFAREGADVIGLDICAPVDPRSGVEPSTPEDLDVNKHRSGTPVQAASTA
jgi:NAD(P)-dependent dehydrogenase (short-subunit alcohol dehydrogenase family)